MDIQPMQVVRHADLKNYPTNPNIIKKVSSLHLRMAG
jgi:hypothetical protein